jgi:hypothetical protein
MKNIILIALLLLAMTGFAKDYDVSGTKEGGQINTTISGTQYIGFGSVDYKVDGHKVTFKCSGTGVNKCRGVVDGRYMYFTTTNGNTFSFNAYMTIINSLMDSMDGAFFAGSYTGRHTQQVSAVSNEGNRCTLVFGIIWQLDARGNGTFKIKIDEISTFSF